MSTCPFHVEDIMNIRVILHFPKLVRTFVPYSTVTKVTKMPAILDRDISLEFR